MMNEEELANVVQLIVDLDLDVRNGNIPEAEKLIASLVNNLSHQHPLKWEMLAAFLIDHLTEAETRAALVHLLPKVKELLDATLPGYEGEF
ncbi:hypothetical protein ES707_04869 [subsurface metagenome]